MSPGLQIPPPDLDDAQEAGDALDAARASHLFVGSLEKGLRVLTAFAADQSDLSLAELSTRSGLDKSATQRFAFTLTALGYLHKDADTRRYRLSAKVLELGFNYLQADTVLERALPHLTETSRQCNETVNFTELDGPDVVYVARLPGQNVVRVHFALGTRAPAYCTATGRAILAHLPRPEALAILDRSKLTRHTSTTIYDRSSLVSLLDQARKDGFAISEGEHFPGVIAIAAPVVDLSGRAVAAVSISVPASTWSVGRVKRELAPIITATARRISADLGGTIASKEALR